MASKFRCIQLYAKLIHLHLLVVSLDLIFAIYFNIILGIIENLANKQSWLEPGWHKKMYVYRYVI